jgi:hypothetical protein
MIGHFIPLPIMALDLFPPVAADGDRRAINAVKEGRSEERPKFGRKRPMRAAMVAKTAATRIYNVTYPTEKSTKKEKQAAQNVVKMQFNGLKIACFGGLWFKH